MKQLLQYFREVVRELKKVSWPTKEQTYQQTVLVLVVVTLIALYLGLLDYFFQWLMGLVVR